MLIGSRQVWFVALLLAAGLTACGPPQDDDDTTPANVDDDDSGPGDDDTVGDDDSGDDEPGDDDDDDTGDDDDSSQLVDGDGDGTPDIEDCDPADPALNEVDADGDLWSTCDGDCDDLDASFLCQWTQVSLGGATGCALATTGRVACWGSSPYLVPPPLTIFTTIATSDGSTNVCGLTTVGAIECWGTDASVPGAEPAGTFVDVDGGVIAACAISDTADLVCWGVTAGWMLSFGTPLAEVAMATRQGCVLTTGGDAFCFGDDEDFPAASPPAGPLSGIDVGEHFACALNTNASPACWRSAAANPNVLQTPTGSYVKLSLQSSSACALSTVGEIDCWGGPPPTPPVGPFDDFSNGGNYGGGIRPGGTLECWGANNAGRASPPTPGIAPQWKQQR